MRDYFKAKNKVNNVQTKIIKVSRIIRRSVNNDHNSRSVYNAYIDIVTHKSMLTKFLCTQKSFLLR